MYSGQISIIPRPELRGFWGDSFTKPPFKVTSAEVVILCPGVCVLWHHLNQLINTHAPSNDKHFLAPSYSLEALEGFACHSFSSKSPPNKSGENHPSPVRFGWLWSFLADFNYQIYYLLDPFSGAVSNDGSLYLTGPQCIFLDTFAAFAY